jgi:hypothetical protein
MRTRFGFGLLAAASLASLQVQAYDLPGLNLGSTSFYDGTPAPDGPGWYLSEYLIYGKTSRFNDQDGRKLPLPKQELTTFARSPRSSMSASPWPMAPCPALPPSCPGWPMPMSMTASAARR